MRTNDKSAMITLALEFSSSVRSVAVLVSKGDKLPAAVAGSASDQSGRAASPLRLVERVLQESAVERELVDTIAVGLGPGSYTGIRSAIALAQGWQLARPVQLLGISTVECLAEQARTSGLLGAVGIVIDAQRDELYYALYEITEPSWREVEALSLVKAEFVRNAIALPGGSQKNGPLAMSSVIGPEANRWFSEARTIIPDAAVLGRLAQNRRDYVSGEELEPIYLRPTSFVKAPPPRSIAL